MSSDRHHSLDHAAHNPHSSSEVRHRSTQGQALLTDHWLRVARKQPNCARLNAEHSAFGGVGPSVTNDGSWRLTAMTSRLTAMTSVTAFSITADTALQGPQESKSIQLLSHQQPKLTLVSKDYLHKFSTVSAWKTRFGCIVWSDSKDLQSRPIYAIWQSATQ
jgi:hypothetical protein